MRALVFPLACALAACTSPALPPATELAASAGPVVAGDGVVYWVEYGNQGLTLMRRELANGTTAAIDLASPGYPGDEGVTTLVVGAGAIVWGYSGGFTGCGALRAVLPDGTHHALESASLSCQGVPLAEAGGQALLLEQDGSVVSIDLATNAVTPRFATDGIMLASPPLSDGHSVYGVFWNDDGTFIGRIDLAQPLDLWTVVPGVRDGTELALHGDDLYWIDRGYAGATPMLYSVASSASEAREIETVAILDGDPRALAWTGDTLWIADSDDEALVRIDPHGTSDRFPTPYVPFGLTGLPDRLLVTAFADRGQRLPLLEQPLP